MPAFLVRVSNYLRTGFRSCLLEKAAYFRIIPPDRFYRYKAHQFGVIYIGIFEKYRVALFQDPVTGSSFAVKDGDPVESGIRRVRARFGLSW